MTESFCALNRCYFSGDKAMNGPYLDYVRSLREDFGKDYRRWDSAAP